MSHTKWFCLFVVVAIFAAILCRTKTEGKAIVIVLTQGRIAPLRSHERKTDEVSQHNRKITVKVKNVDRKTWKIIKHWINKRWPTKKQMFDALAAKLKKQAGHDSDPKDE